MSAKPPKDGVPTKPRPATMRIRCELPGTNSAIDASVDDGDGWEDRALLALRETFAKRWAVSVDMVHLRWSRTEGTGQVLMSAAEPDKVPQGSWRDLRVEVERVV